MSTVFTCDRVLIYDAVGKIVCVGVGMGVGLGVVCLAHPRTSVTICDPASLVLPLSAFTEIMNEGRSLSVSLKISLTL